MGNVYLTFNEKMFWTQYVATTWVWTIRVFHLFDLCQFISH